MMARIVIMLSTLIATACTGALASTQRAPAAATATLGGPVVLIRVLPNGVEVSRTVDHWVGIDYGNGVPRQVVITMLVDAIFRDGFEVMP